MILQPNHADMNCGISIRGLMEAVLKSAVAFFSPIFNNAAADPSFFCSVLRLSPTRGNGLRLRRLPRHFRGKIHDCDWAKPSLVKHNKVLNLHNRLIGADAYSAGGTAKHVGPASFSFCASVRLTGTKGISAQACGNPIRDN